ncbi:MAG: MFS transporter [Burkholderiaceae bacterium]|nr:MFS transporter [Burkholderiaceae bacterium]
MKQSETSPSAIDSPQAAWRLLTTLLLMLLGNSGMYVVSVVLPEVQAEFGVSRADASIPYTLSMLGFGIGGMWMGRWADRFGIAWVAALGALGVASGFVLAGVSGGIVGFALAQGLLGLLGIASTFAPLLADTAQWWNKRRGIAVAVCASGNYLAGTLWPPIAQWGVTQVGWRTTYLCIGLFCGIGMALLSLRMRTKPPTAQAATVNKHGVVASDRPFGLSVTQAQWLLSVAGVGCCVAMAMPQVHIVAYCSDLGFGAARGAEMLSLMLACGIVSRLVSGAICDRIGGIRTLLLGSALQGIALMMFLPFDGLVPLYVVSAMFGLFQGGIVPSYAIIVREHFPAKEAGARTGTIIMATLVGMALGGWLSGKIFDVTGSYNAAFINGIAWNALNFGIVFWLYRRHQRHQGLQALNT